MSSETEKVIEEEWNGDRGAYVDHVMGGPICFASGTTVKMQNGWTPIDSIVSGQMVETFNFTDNSVELKEVLFKNSFQSDSIILLTFGSDTIRCTHEHPFYVDGVGWVSANKLKRGDKIKSLSASYVEVESVIREYFSGKVYNIQVADNENYYVMKSVGGILVHNRSYLPIEEKSKKEKSNSESDSFNQLDENKLDFED